MCPDFWAEHGLSFLPGELMRACRGPFARNDSAPPTKIETAIHKSFVFLNVCIHNTKVFVHSVVLPTLCMCSYLQTYFTGF